MELKNCPFCGGKAVLDRAMLTRAFRVVCSACGTSTARLGQVMDCPTPPAERISTAWNTRANLPTDREAKLIAALTAAVSHLSFAADKMKGWGSRSDITAVSMAEANARATLAELGATP